MKITSILRKMKDAGGKSEQKFNKELYDLNPWFYPVIIEGEQVIPGIGTEQDAATLNERTLFREQQIVDAVVRKYDMKGKYVLDIASNIGYWSSRYVDYGAEQVVCVEGRELFVKQAQLYWKQKNAIPDFIVGDVCSEKTWSEIENKGKFDVCLCCGILYHIPNVIYLLEKMCSITNDLILIDTRVETETKDRKERSDLYFNSIPKIKKVITPRKENIIHYLQERGFDVEIVRPRFLHPQSVKSCDDYNKGRRVTIAAWRIK